MIVIIGVKHNKYNCDRIKEIFYPEDCIRFNWSYENNYIPNIDEHVYISDNDYKDLIIGNRIRNGVPISDDYKVFEDLRVDKIDEILNCRKIEEESGIYIDNIFYKTDRYSRTALAQHKLYAMNNPAYSIDWQANDIPEFVSMYEEQINNVLYAMEQHVQPIFTKSKRIIADISSIDPTSINAIEQLEAIKWSDL